MKVRDWMSPDPVSVSPDTTVSAAREVMASEVFRHLPVVAAGQLIGIISDRDVAINDAALRAAVRRHDVASLVDDDRPVESVMSATPHVIDEDADLTDAARLLVSYRINALPVVDADKMLVGILTSVDCLLATLPHAVDT
jgi:acetoin utilization protein AcuB